MHNFKIGLASLLLFLLGCSQPHSDSSPAAAALERKDSPPNFLILIGDDMGVETLLSYGIGESTASTPNLDRLAASGVQFEHFWVQPTCSPTRATLLTGRYGFRTGVLIPGYPREDLIDVELPAAAPDAPKELVFTPRGYLAPGQESPRPKFMDFSKPPTDGLPPDEVTFPQRLKTLPAAYATAAVGKWHLADSRNGWLSSPNQAGFDYYSGLLMGEADSHYRWLHVSQGEASAAAGYIDERAVQDGLQWLNTQAATDKPWLLWVAFTNPHTPFTLPPKHLLNSEASKALSGDELTPDNTQPYAMAMIEAMDTLIGRLLKGIPESERDNTYILFMGDNGSVKWAQPAKPVDAKRAKMTVYEGGIRVPLIVAGPGIPKGVATKALANSVDVFATLLELAGANDLQAETPSSKLDSRSLAGLLKDPSAAGPRDWIYSDGTDLMTGKLNYAIRDAEFKLVSIKNKRELFHLAEDPWENNNLLARKLSAEHDQALARLTSYVESLLATK